MPLLPSTPPRGMRDHLPEAVERRLRLRTLLERLFQRYGFQPLETSAMEQREALVGQYGEEGDKLMFHVLNSGDYLSARRKEDNKDLDLNNPKLADDLRPYISQKALRYDLTLPLARCVAAAGSQLVMPFKRYQMQPVWRADRPQKGRYREFMQCDADIVGSNSWLCELEMLSLIIDAFRELKLLDKNLQLRLNHRDLLAAMARKMAPNMPKEPFHILLDSMDKVDIEEVPLDRTRFQDVFSFREFFKAIGKEKKPLDAFEELLGPKERDSIQPALGLLKCLFDKIKPKEREPEGLLLFDPSLARGMSYYTGLVFEVTYKLSTGDISNSLLGGGRYDNLTGRFAKQGLPGIGLSFGLERIEELLIELGKFDLLKKRRTYVLMMHTGEVCMAERLRLLDALREKDIACEHYLEEDKLKKQFAYAERKGMSHVVFAGEKERETGHFSLKCLLNGEQKSLSEAELLKYLEGFTFPKTD